MPAVNSPRRRVSVLGLLLICLIATLVARAGYIQLIDPHPPVQSAYDTHWGSITVPAVRGEIFDSRGRVLVGNKTAHVVTVDRAALDAQPDHGSAVLSQLAKVLGSTPVDLRREITPCGVNSPAPCWTGEPYQPVPLDSDASSTVVLAIAEHGELFAGVKVITQTVPDYPGQTLASHLLGYTAAVSASDKKSNAALVDADTIGRTGLEEFYDSVLRGTDGAQSVQLDPRGEAVGMGEITPAKQGDSLITSIDAGVQALAEQALADQIKASRAKGYAAPSGSIVVMDPHTGRIIAAASYPSYDPSVFIGGISVADYAKLTAPAANNPLVGRAISGAYAPGSTFKLISASSDVMNGEIGLNATYPCPGSLTVDGRTKTNFDSESFGGSISLQTALQVSCDTFFYAPAVSEWQADQRAVDTGGQASEHLQTMAKAFGVGASPGVDLPADQQASGSIGDRASRLANWTANKATYCANAAAGYPAEKDPAMRAYLTQLASENCTDGWRFFAGNNADTAIGQGDTTMSPLQLALAYSALVNGGTLYAPTLGWAVVDHSGKVVKTINPTVVGTVPVNADVLNYISNSLHFTNSHSVSGAIAFDGSPIKTLIGGKTGTAEVQGKQDTSLFAGWGPVQPGASADTAKFVVVGMIEQAGLGSAAAAPAVKQVFSGLLGANGPAVLANSVPASTLPTIGPS